MSSRIIKAFLGLIFAFIVIVCIFGILPQMGVESPFANLANIENPFASLFEDGKNGAANAALDMSGLKQKAADALENNRDRIAEMAGLSASQVDTAIDELDIENWQITSLPADASATGTANIGYGGTQATITTYDDPSVVTITTLGQDITLAVPDSAQDYVGYLGYLG